MFDFQAPSSRSLVKNSIDELTSTVQLTYQNATSKRMFLIINEILIENCLDYAEASVKLHGLESNDISDEKKWAHISFWLLKLCPITYITDIPIGLSFRGRLSPTNKTIKIKKDFNHISVNTQISYYLFIWLYCTNNFPDTDAKDKFIRALSSSNTEETLDSLRRHNYSARSLAMFLETLMKEKII